jgi:hypothetical protein
VIGELAAGAPPTELHGATSTRVFADDLEVALRRPAATAARCAEELAIVLRPELAVILDVQMVSVADGRVLWTYRRVGNPSDGPEARVTQHYSAQPGHRPEGRAGWKIVVGSIALGVGTPALLATGIIDGTGGDEVDLPRNLYAAELGLLALGIYSLATADSDARWTYAPPDTVICQPRRFGPLRDLPEDAIDGWEGPACDGRCRRVLTHVDAAVADLFTSLAALREGSSE